MQFIRPPFIYRKLFPELTWKMPATENILYLTFDDGPEETITPWVLEVLYKYNVKATFFCIGENIKKNPGIYDMILEQGHATGNHTYNHLNGWETDNETYFKNTGMAAGVCKSALFRPPYGKITFGQARELGRQYRIVMWDVLSYDFDLTVSPEQCFRNVTGNTTPGSIIVFHDSLKASPNMKHALPLVLEHFLQKDFRFDVIPCQAS